MARLSSRAGALMGTIELAPSCSQCQRWTRGWAWHRQSPQIKIYSPSPIDCSFFASQIRSFRCASPNGPAQGCDNLASVLCSEGEIKDQI